MYNQHNFQKKLSICQFQEVIVDKLLTLERSYRTGVSHTSATPKLAENRFYRILATKHQLEETKTNARETEK